MKKMLIFLVFIFFYTHSLPAQICDIKSFLDKCPTNDPAFETILNDFEIRLNGEIISDFTCYEPVSEMDIADYSNPLIYLQTLRVIYYMDRYMSGHLPWTDTPLYDWMKNRVDGIHIKDGVSGGYCCEMLDGKLFFVSGNADDAGREVDKKWIGISGNIGFFAHEVRHVDGYPHTSTICCMSTGCDQEYNESDLGAYGIQYWLNKSWLTGLINVGVETSHTAFEITEATNWHLGAVNYQFRNRFCENIPDLINVEDIDDPFGTNFQSELMLSTSILPGTYLATTIEANGMIDSPWGVNLLATDAVTLSPGFFAKSGSKVLAGIFNCEPTLPSLNTETLAKPISTAYQEVDEESFSMLADQRPSFYVWPNPFSEELSIAVTLQEKDLVSLRLLDMTGREVRTLQHPMEKKPGIYREVMKKEALHQGVYCMVLQVGTKYYTQKVMVID